MGFFRKILRFKKYLYGDFRSVFFEYEVVIRCVRVFIFIGVGSLSEFLVFRDRFSFS